MKTRSLDDVLALPRSQCEAEPIHMAPGIHPAGMLLIVDAKSLAIVSHSQNAPAILGIDDIAPAAHIFDILPEAQAHIEMLRDEPSVPYGSFTLERENLNNCGVVVHNGETRFFIEVLPQNDTFEGHSLDETSVSSRLFGIVRALRNQKDLHDLSNAAAREIRKATQYERVLIYRFDKDGHGEVIGESLSPDWNQSLLGFRFPESDIPAQARALYTKSVLRYLPSVDYTPVPMVPAQDPETQKPFDIGLAWTRSQSPIHLMYQKNLGVDGAMSISIMDGDRLWGMVVCHHRSPHYVSAPAKLLAININEAFSMQFGDVEHIEEYEARENHARLHARLLEQIAGTDSVFDAITTGPVTLKDLFFASSSAAIVFKDENDNDDVLIIGEAPPKDAVLSYASWLRGTELSHSKPIYATDCVFNDFPGFEPYADVASGSLICAIGDDLQNLLIWFRPEIVQTITWGGNPYEKNHTSTSHAILPRKSFERWTEIKRKHSRPWSQWQLDIAQSLRNAFNDLILRQFRTVMKLNEELARSNRVKTDFLANMSHELRTPLNAIIGFSNTMNAELFGKMGNEKYVEYSYDIQNAGSHLLELINDILDISAIEAEKIELHDEVVAWPNVVNASLALVKGRAKDHDVKLLHEQLETPIQLRVDERRIKQVIINLLTNAIKFTPAGGQVILREAFDQDQNFIITIQDTGIGMDEDDIEKALMPFGQVRESIAISSEGTGLGLPLSKALVALHGGTMTLKSTKGEGTSVDVLIPNDRVVA